MVEIARESVTLITQSVDQAKLFVNAGVAHVSDQLMAEVRLSEAKNGVTRAENGLKLAKSGLNMLMGASITADYELVEVAETIPKLGISLEELLSMAERQRSELKLLDAQSDIARRNIKIAWSGFIPQSGLFFQGGYQSGQDFMPDWSWAAGAVASIPLWEWGKRYYQIKSAQAAYREADGQREYAREGILLQVKQAYLDLSSAEQLIATSEAARKESKENHRVMKMKYEAQMATMLEVLTAALMVSKAEADYFSALYDYGMAMARLARSVEAEAHKISDARPMTMECN
jgi:outer membrane protein TolC